MLTFLAVDDDPLEAERLCRIAAGLGFETLRAGTGAEALEPAEAHQPEVVVVDVSLPDLSGLEVLRRLRFNVRTRQAGVILADPDPKEDEVLYGFRYFSDAHWQRPVEEAALVRLLTLAFPDPARMDKPPARFTTLWCGLWDDERDRITSGVEEA